MNDRTAGVFVDTNVLIYAYDSSAGPVHKRAEALLNQLWNDGNGCLSVQVLQEFYVTASRKLPLSRNELPLILGDLCRWTVHSPQPQDVLRAIAMHQRHRISYWDAMIVCSARQLGCRWLWTEDLHPGQTIEGVEIVNPLAIQP